MTLPTTQAERIDFLLERLLAETPEYRDLSTGTSFEEKKNLLRSLINIRPPRPLEDEVLKVQDAYLTERSREEGIVTPEEIPTLAQAYGYKGPFADRLSIWQGDITRLATDAIVNAANAQMLGCFMPLHACIDNCIHTYAGMQLRADCDRRMKNLRRRYGEGYEHPTAVPLVTDAYNLPSRKIVHIVGPIVTGPLTKAHRQSLKACYETTLDRCFLEGLTSVAFCCISTGVFHFPAEEAAHIATDTVSVWLSERPEAMERVVFNVFSEADRRLYESIFT